MMAERWGLCVRVGFVVGGLHVGGIFSSGTVA